MSPTCTDCYFFKPDTEFFGDCRRHSPDAKLTRVDRVTVSGGAEWPNVSKEDWCGDFANAADFLPREQA